MGLQLFWSKGQETHVIVFALLAAILVLIGITAVSSLDLSNNKRR
jgi:hypothetical protein